MFYSHTRSYIQTSIGVKFVGLYKITYIYIYIYYIRRFSRTNYTFISFYIRVLQCTYISLITIRKCSIEYNVKPAGL